MVVPDASMTTCLVHPSWPYCRGSLLSSPPFHGGNRSYLAIVRIFSSEAYSAEH